MYLYDFQADVSWKILKNLSNQIGYYNYARTLKKDYYSQHNINSNISVDLLKLQITSWEYKREIMTQTSYFYYAMRIYFSFPCTNWNCTHFDKNLSNLLSVNLNLTNAIVCTGETYEKIVTKQKISYVKITNFLGRVWLYG